MEENENDKYSLTHILIRNGGFSPKMVEDLTKHIDLLLKLEDMKWQNN